MCRRKRLVWLVCVAMLLMIQYLALYNRTHRMERSRTLNETTPKHDTETNNFRTKTDGLRKHRFEIGNEISKGGIGKVQFRTHGIETRGISKSDIGKSDTRKMNIDSRKRLNNFIIDSSNADSGFSENTVGSKTINLSSSVISNLANFNPILRKQAFRTIPNISTNNNHKLHFLRNRKPQHNNSIRKYFFKESESIFISTRSTDSTTATTTTTTTPAKTCDAKTHVAFVKVHKAGSTTVANIIHRFGEERKLIFVLNKKHNRNYLGTFKSEMNTDVLLPPPVGRHYDMLVCHVVYKRATFHAIMPKDTIYIAIVRDPFELFVSSSYYYQGSLKHMHLGQGEDIVMKYLNNITYYDIRHSNPIQRNSMSHDFGIDTNDLKTERINVDRTISDFDLIIVLEYLDESLILLRRLLCWELQDVLYIRKNVNYNKWKVEYSQKYHMIHKQSSAIDYYLYEEVIAMFFDKLSQQEADFFVEVKHFQRLQAEVIKYCHNPPQVIPASLWNREFELTQNECDRMKIAEIELQNLSRFRQVGLNRGK